MMSRPIRNQDEHDTTEARPSRTDSWDFRGFDGGTWLGLSLSKGYTDVTEQVDTERLELLNGSDEYGNTKALFDPSEPSGGIGGKCKTKSTKHKRECDWVESDSDDQLMLFISFQEALNVRMLHITSLPPQFSDNIGQVTTTHPKTIRVFANRRQGLGFRFSEDISPPQTIIITPQNWDQNTGTARVELESVKFQNITSLVVFVVDGDGIGDRVRIDRLRIIGNIYKFGGVTDELEREMTEAWTLSANAALLVSKYRSEWHIEDLKEAVFCAQAAVNATPHGDPNRASRLSTLGAILGLRFERTGKLEDLEDALCNLQEAVKTTPLDDPYRASRLNSLATGLGYRFERTKALKDLEEAILKMQECVKDHDDPEQAMHLTNLGTLLGSRFNRLKVLDDLEEAIRNVQEAVNTTPKNNPNRALRLNRLGRLLCDKFSNTKALADLDEAIRNMQESVEITPNNHPERGLAMSNLGMAIGSRFKVTRTPKDLEDGILNLREAVKILPHNHPQRACIFYNLGELLEIRFDMIKALKDQEEAKAMYIEAADLPNTPPFDGFQAGFSAGLVCVQRSEWAEASKLLQAALELLPRICTRSLNQDDQQYILSVLPGVSSLAASTTLAANQPASDALKLFEAGHCLIASYAIDGRSDISDLRAVDSILCEEYEKYREEVSLHRIRLEFETNDGYESAVESMKRSLTNLANTETKIRRIPGFERFQSLPEPADLMKLAETGPIVAFNVSTIRSDAIIVTSSKIWAINLPLLTCDELQAKAKIISTAGARSPRKAVLSVKNRSQSLHKVQLKDDLLWLWKVAVQPVLNEPEILQQKSRRIWWVNSGVMGLVPIHAAGEHSEGSLENTLSRVISSYTPTFRALRYARQKAKVETSDNRLLLVDMPTTPGQADLKTEHEVDVIKREFGDLVTRLEHPNKAEVLGELKRSSIAHFACHGESNAKNPSEGGLLLVEQGKTTLLTVQELNRVNLLHAEIAFLSACSTAELVDGDLVDEAIHLSNCFQTIGFRHVIGTMWGADDYTAGEIAGLFYKTLAERQSDMELQVAQALHDAVVKLKSRLDIGQDVLKWGCFIHIGA